MLPPRLPLKFLTPPLCVVVLAIALPPSGRADDHPDRPNIVLIVADDLGYGELGCFGQKIIKTPNLDRLAQQGMRFAQYYCGSPVCAPSRCTLLTGKHSGHAAIRNNQQPAGMKDLSEKYQWEFPGQEPLPASEVTIAELLKARGYATVAVGKWGLGQVGNDGDPAQHGFDLFYGFLCQYHAHNHYPKFLWRNATKETLPGNSGGPTGKTYAQDRFTDEALKFIGEHKDGPFFLYLPFTIPHLSIQVPDSALEPYAGKIQETPYKHTGEYVQHPTPHAGYAAMITYLDSAIGQIVERIENDGLSDNTLILFTSDNGPSYGRLGGADSDFFNSAGPLRDRKGSVYEGGIRVPLIARWPGKIKSGQVSEHITASWDMLPTLCEITHINPPPDQDGISFLPTLRGNSKQADHDYLYWEFPAYGSQQAVRLGDWKAVRHGVNLGDSKFELYNLSTDLAEQHNVADAEPNVIRQVQEIVHIAHTPSKTFPLLASEQRKPAKKRAAPKLLPSKTDPAQ